MSFFLYYREDFSKQILLLLFYWFIWLHSFSVAARGIWFPDQGLNPGPQHWEWGVLATGTPGKFQSRTGHGTTDWFQIGKGVRQGCILSPCLFNLYAEYIMRNAGLEEAQAGIKIAGRNINNLRNADDTTLMAESKEELKSLLMKVKEESENLAQDSTFRKLRSWHLVLSLHGKYMGKQWKQWQTLFSRAPKSLQMLTAAMKSKDTCSLEEKLWPT